MQHAAARWADEDDCPQIVADGNDIEAVKNLVNSAPPVDSADPNDDALYYRGDKDGKFFLEKKADDQGR